MEESIIRCKNITKKYGERFVLKDFSLEIKKGDTLGLIGKSGVGKTTLLRILSDLTSIDSGSIFRGSNKIGYVFQEHRLIPWKTVIGNIVFCLVAFGESKKNAHQKARYFLNQMELSEYEDHYPHELSGGMCQRVSIARAFAIDPDILLMDEPFTALDPRLKEILHNYIKKFLASKPIAALYVSHIPREILKITDKIYVIHDNGNLSLYVGNDNNLDNIYYDGCVQEPASNSSTSL
jgi:ABC-type nitrate/sulfonate/bicarbonate transport system ATPase subunit